MANCYTLEELQYEKHVRRDGDNCRKWTSRCCRPNTMWLGGRELWQVAARQWCQTVQDRLALGTPRDRTWNSIRAATGNQWSPIGSMRQWRGLVAPLYHVLARFWHVQIFFKVSWLVTTKLSYHFMNSVRKLWANKAQLLNILKFSPRPGTHYPHSLTHCHDFFPHWHAKLHAKA